MNDYEQLCLDSVIIGPFAILKQDNSSSAAAASLDVKSSWQLAASGFMAYEDDTLASFQRGTPACFSVVMRRAFDTILV